MNILRGALVISVFIAIYGLILYLTNLKKIISPYKPFWKFFSIKAALFLSVWQEKIIKIIQLNKIFVLDKETQGKVKLDSGDYVNNFLLCGEMFVLAVVAIKHFSYQDFKKGKRDSIMREESALIKIPKILYI